MPSLLEGVELRDPTLSLETVLRLGAGLPERAARRVHLVLASVPDPDTSVRFLERLRHHHAAIFDRIVSSPAALRAAAAIFSYSRFLSESVLQNPERILEVAGSGSLYRVLRADEYEERLLDFLGKENQGVPASEAVARFRRRQLLRIVS